MNLDVSRDGGSTWSPIGTTTTGAASAGTYLWVTSGPPTTHARVRVSWAINPTASDMSDVDFGLAGPILTVTSPNGAGKVTAGAARQITFTHNLGVGQVVNIDLSRDGGATWTALTSLTTTSGTSGAFDWVVSGPCATRPGFVRAGRRFQRRSTSATSTSRSRCRRSRRCTSTRSNRAAAARATGSSFRQHGRGCRRSLRLESSGNDDTHIRLGAAPNTLIAPGGYLIVEEAALGFGLGTADSVR